MKVEDVMTKDIVSVDKDVDLRYVMKLMEKHDVTKIPALEEKRLVGIVTDNIIAYKLGSIRKRGVPASRLHASSVLEKDFKTVEPDQDIHDILKNVGEPGATMIPVLEKDNLVGVLTKADLLPLVESKQKISKIMKKKIHTVYPDDRVVHARRIMIDNDIARLPVTDKGELVGMISDIDIAFAFADLKRSTPLGRQKHKLDTLLVQDAMKTPVIFTSDDISSKAAAKIMLKEHVGALPVLKDGKLIGIVSRTDLVKTISF